MTQHVRVVCLDDPTAAACRAENPLTEAQLDEAIEAHLAAKFGEKLDFALEAAVPTLLADGLVSRDGKVLCTYGS